MESILELICAHLCTHILFGCRFNLKDWVKENSVKKEKKPITWEMKLHTKGAHKRKDEAIAF